MKIILKWGLILFSCQCIMAPLYALEQAKLTTYQLSLIKVDGLTFKDMNRDGELTPYEDWRLPPSARADDLLNRLSLAEKAGLMMHGSAPSKGDSVGYGEHYDMDKLNSLITIDKVNSFITRLQTTPKQFAEQNNSLQQIAEGSPLAIPLTISVDPRNTYYYGNSLDEKTGFSQWPGTLGMAAIADEQRLVEYGDIIRQEYRVLGITQALSPQADLATEPRWSRFEGTFGEDAELVKKMVRGYITGIQHGQQGLSNQSVSGVVKHWVGYGAAELGFDSHNAYGKYALFTVEDSLAQHLIPFTGAFEANVAGVMPTYSILKNARYRDHAIEPVGGGFNRFLLHDLLREQYHFDGVVISDWSITNDCNDECINGFPEGVTPKVEGMPWGVEQLSKADRFIKAVNAGVDQFGGVADSSIIVNAVQQNKLTLQQIDQAVHRILVQKFALGQFESPYVETDQAANFVGNPTFQSMADKAQSDSLVLLENRDNLLPLTPNTRVYLYGFLPSAKELTNKPFMQVNVLDNADVVIARINAPYEQTHKNYFFGARYHEGDLSFSSYDKDRQFIEQASKSHPVIVVIYLDRPAVLSPLNSAAKAVIANFGIKDELLLARLLDPKPYQAHLPFALPASMQSVLEQAPDKANDMETLYPLGFGLTK